MKSNKIKLSLLLVLVFSIILSACGSNDQSKESGDSKNDEGSKTLRVVTNATFNPMEFLEGDKVVGFDADFIKAVAKEAGYEVKIEHTGWEAMFVEIEKKTADLAVAAITISDDRKQTYDFSVPYYQSTPKILVPKNSDIKSVEDLKNNKIIAVQNQTTGHATAENILGEKSPKIKPFDDNNLAIMEMLSGGADAVITDKPVVEEYVKTNPDDNLTIIDIPESEAEYYGILFPKGSELKPEFDKAVNKIFDNGIYEKIYKKWFGTEPDIETLRAQQ